MCVCVCVQIFHLALLSDWLKQICLSTNKRSTCTEGHSTSRIPSKVFYQMSSPVSRASLHRGQKENETPFLNYARKIWWSLLYFFLIGGMARWDHGTSERFMECSPHWWNPMSNSIDFMQLSGLFLLSSLTSVGSSPYFQIATFLRSAQIWVIKWPPCLLPQWSQMTSENVWQGSS